MRFSSARLWAPVRWSVLTASLVLAVGCQEPPKEWDVPDWTPIAAVPLVDTRFDLGDVLEVVSDSAGTVPIEDLGGGELAFVHDETFEGTLALDWLVLPQESAGGTLVLGDVEAAALNVALGPVAFTDTLSVELEVEQPEGVRLDAIDLSGGQLTLNLNSTLGDDVSGEVTIPQLLDQTGLPWSTVWTQDMLDQGPLVVVEMLSGWTLLPSQEGEDNNAIHLVYTAYVTNDPAYDAQAGESLDVSFNLADLTYARVEGDFGQSAIQIERSSAAISFFDDRFTTSDLAINRASLSLSVTNGFGVPAVLDSLSFYTEVGGVPDVVFETTMPNLEVAPAVGDASGAVLSTWEVNETNSNVVDFFSDDEVEVELGLYVRTNPVPPAAGEPNFLDADGFVNANLHAEVPLSIRAGQVDFVDTLDVSLDLEETAELDSAELRMILHNGFPFELKVQAWFLDAQGALVDSLALAPLDIFAAPDVGPTGQPLAPAEFRFDFEFDWDRADRLRAADRVVVRAWGQTVEAPLGTFVPLRAEQDLRMQLGAKLFTRIEL